MVSSEWRVFSALLIGFRLFLGGLSLALCGVHLPMQCVNRADAMRHSYRRKLCKITRPQRFGARSAGKIFNFSIFSRHEKKRDEGFHGVKLEATLARSRCELFLDSS